MRLTLAVVLLSLVAGCAGEPDPPGDVGVVQDLRSCHAADPVPSRSAPLAPGFVGDPGEVLARLAEAVGVLPTSELVEVEPQRWTQWSDDGELRLERTQNELFGALTYVGWTSNGSATFSPAQARAVVQSLARGFGAPVASLNITTDSGANEVSFWQQLDGKRLGDAGGVLHLDARPMLSMRALHTLPEPSFSVTEAAARAIAQPHARCILDASGRTGEAGYTDEGVEGAFLALHGESVVWSVLVRFAEPGEPSHCGMGILVRVDAMTGAVLGAGRPPCD